MARPIIEGTECAGSNKGRLVSIQQALSKCPPPDSGNGPDTPVMTAVRAKNHELLQILLRAKASPHAVDHHGSSVLHLSSYQGNISITRTLLHAQADPNVRDHLG